MYKEYALFSAMIEQNVVGYDPEALTVVICEQTKPHLDTLEFALEGPATPPKNWWKLTGCAMSNRIRWIPTLR